jgi:hypothetical protein
LKIREKILSDFLAIDIVKNKHRDTVKDVHYLKTCHHWKRSLGCHRVSIKVSMFLDMNERVIVI